MTSAGERDDEVLKLLMLLCASDNPDQGRPKVSYGFMREILSIIGPLTERAAAAEDRLENVQKEADAHREEAAKSRVMLSHMRDRMNARDT